MQRQFLITFDNAGYRRFAIAAAGIGDAELIRRALGDYYRATRNPECADRPVPLGLCPNGLAGAVHETNQLPRPNTSCVMIKMTETAAVCLDMMANEQSARRVDIINNALVYFLSPRPAEA